MWDWKKYIYLSYRLYLFFTSTSSTLYIQIRLNPIQEENDYLIPFNARVFTRRYVVQTSSNQMSKATFTDSKPITEIKIHILHSAPNIDTLWSLVHASPVMHTLYAKTRQRIFTIVTFNELRSRNVDLLPLPTAISISVKNMDRKFVHDVKSALENLYGQKQHIRLAVEDCKVLRSVLSISSLMPFVAPYNLMLFPFANSVPKSSNISREYRKDPNTDMSDHITRQIQEIVILRVNEEDEGTMYSSPGLPYQLLWTYLRGGSALVAVRTLNREEVS